MKNITKMLCVGASALALGLSGCVVEGAENSKPREPKRVDYCAKTEIFSPHGSFVVTGDFNEDGHLDFLVTGESTRSSDAESYLWIGDGHGNFKLRTYPFVSEDIVDYERK